MSYFKLWSQDVHGVPYGTVRLVFKGRRVSTSDKISDYGIEEGDVIQVFPVQAGC